MHSLVQTSSVWHSKQKITRLQTDCSWSTNKLEWAAQGDATETPESQPEAGPYWSLMFEVSESKQKAVNNDVADFAGGKWSGVVKECMLGALATKLIQKDDQIVSLYHRC